MSISSYGLQPHRRSSVGDLSSKSISPTCLGLLESQTILHMPSYKRSAPAGHDLILLKLNNSSFFHTITTSSFIDTTSTSNHAFQPLPPTSPHRCRLRPTNRIIQDQRCLRQRRVPLVPRYDHPTPLIPIKTSTNELTGEKINSGTLRKCKSPIPCPYDSTNLTPLLTVSSKSTGACAASTPAKSAPTATTPLAGSNRASARRRARRAAVAVSLPDEINQFNQFGRSFANSHKSTAAQMPTATSTAASTLVLAAAATASRGALTRTWGFPATLITFATLLVEKMSRESDGLRVVVMLMG